MQDKFLYVNMCFLTLVGSKTNSSTANHWGKWMVIIIVVSKWIINLVLNN
jgi:hypothetical protein